MWLGSPIAYWRFLQAEGIPRLTFSRKHRGGRR